MQNHAVPSLSGATGDLARQLARLVGPAVQAGDETVAAAHYLALATELAAARQTTLDAIAEATPATADDLLAEWESVLAVPVNPGASTAARRAAVLARIRAIAGTRQRIGRTTKMVAGGTTSTTEYLYSAVTSEPRKVFRFVLTVPAAAIADGPTLSALDELLQRQAPAHTTWNFASGATFRFDDTDRGFDRGVFG